MRNVFGSNYSMADLVTCYATAQCEAVGYELDRDLSQGGASF